MKEFLSNRLARLKRDLQIKLEIKAFPKCNIIIQDKFSEKQLKAKADATGMASTTVPYRGDWIVTAYYQGYEISDEIRCGSYGEDYFLDLTKTCSLTIQTDEGNLIELINGDERIEAIATNGSFNEIVQGGTWTLVVRDADNADLKIMTRFEIPLDQREVIKEFYFPTITVSGDNADISVESGNISLNKIMNGGTVKFKTIPGIWIVKSSLGSDKDEKNVEVSEIGVNYEVELYFPGVTIKTDTGNWVEISENEKIVASGIATNGEFKVKLGRGNWEVKSCLNDNRDIYVEDEFEIEEFGEDKEVELYLSTILITSDAWEGIVVTADKFGLSNTGIIDVNGNTVIKVGIGNWQISLNKGKINPTSATITRHSQNVDLYLDVTFIYGVNLETNIRTDDAVGFNKKYYHWPYQKIDANPGYAYDISDFDKCMPWKGMVVETRNYSTAKDSKMVKIPKFWYKIIDTGKSFPLIKISNKYVSGFHISPAHMDRGDGKGEREVVYIGRYKVGQFSDNEISKAGCLPVAYNNYFTRRKQDNLYAADFAMRFTIWLLFLVEFCSFNSQFVIGKGGGKSTGVQLTGYTDSMKYHTGYMEKVDQQGVGIQYRNIEGLWDNVREVLSGCYYTDQGFFVDINLNTGHWAVSGQDTNGVLVGPPFKTGYPTSLKIVNNPFPMFYPKTTYTTEDSYTSNYSVGTCDRWVYNKNKKIICVGGYYKGAYLTQLGLFYVDCISWSNSTKWTTRAMELP